MTIKTIKFVINDFHFYVYPKQEYIKLINPSDVTDANHADLIDAECVLFFFSEIEREIPYQALTKYPFREALDKYKKLKAFI